MFSRSLGHPIDEDEPVDVMEQIDFHPVSRVTLARITACLGISCWLPSKACDNCKLNDKHPKKERAPDVLALMDKFAGRDFLPKKVEPEFGSRIRAQIDQLLAATTCRGSRARAELRVSGRMGF